VTAGFVGIAELARANRARTPLQKSEALTQ
jgi:hypothetical protein